jgi:hypothetical protein
LRVSEWRIWLKSLKAFEFSVLTLTVPGLRAEKIQNPACFRVSAPFSFALAAVFRIIEGLDLSGGVAV